MVGMSEHYERVVFPHDIGQDFTLERDDMPELLFADRKALADICRRHQIQRLSLFGSRLKGTARPDSDIDLLVESAPDRRPDLSLLAGIEAEQTGLAGGRPVELRTAQDLSPHFRAEVIRTAAIQYAA